MLVIPAIDVKDGRCVRLYQGLMQHETVYCRDPWRMARRWQDEGSAILHIVDLNGAVEGFGVNDDSVREIVSHTDMLTELGGGIRDIHRISAVLGMGVGRVILGTAAAENPALLIEAIERFGPEQIIVGIDARDGVVATKGWVASAGIPAVELALSMKELGVTRIIYTDIARDGALTGPNIPETVRIAAETGLKITASGGVSSLDDLRDIKKIEATGIDSVIVGKALYEEKFTLPEAIKAVE